MSTPLAGKKVAILATDGFEQSELVSPRKALLDAGAEVDIISIKPGTIRGWEDDHWGEEIKVDKLAQEVSAVEYNALVLPGGLFNPDALRQDTEAKRFVDGFFQEDYIKPVAAICHGPWMLAEIDKLKGRKVTSYPSIRTDLENAGANWVDEQVVVDNGLVTSRKPGDLQAFNKKLVEEVWEGRHSE
ncbi:MULTISPECIES: type 1 glutamine amidotransferase domain-containing protein [Pseudoalteromonas]|uniref:Glutamine amidotransferase n=1 Tax=Pseudoalteromonas ruthenica TaxID=151081 RepID=A0A0F4PYS2_9GAMM|nr:MULTISPECIES: type 1 glutamine amidotransferase domain-containing protein [Pseudoalteromonas]KJY99963.1 glutamine amidotransferase [Pseudoalteromonas ruthenica]KJZ00209.1 glutamine amidotransferase [Pseudoalteromonas ruthenica]MCF2861482.1 type 1 glutamine amidotransferase [Pseudoalteromonas sp. CNAT2-18]MCG7542744.1 type 1 glutamine amidotransferase [Pseudoalteromonas sp. MM17-2]MCG7557479.1 type 1 glutamine amidotransferase [Pseudoalteromonas sp. CNAT2-18.1]